MNLGFNFKRPSSSIYEPTYKLYHYQDDVFRLVLFSKREKGWEKEQNTKNGVNTQEKNITPDDEIERISLSRVKREVKEYALCNNFKYFVTLTVNSKHCDRFSLQECQDNLRKLIKEYARRSKRNNKKFHYLLITEKHKNGAFHFHGLFSDLLEKDIYINENGYISSHYFNEHLGFCSFSEIRDILKCANYITKYITKDCVKNENNRIYFCSKGLSRAAVYDLPARDVKVGYNLSEEFWSYSNDFCKVKDFHYSELSDSDKMFLFTNYS